MNEGADGSDYTNIMSNDAKRLLVDKGFDFVNSTANNEIQKFHFLLKQQLIYLEEQNQILASPLIV